jgi:RHS repeat-associated protein
VAEGLVGEYDENGVELKGYGYLPDSMWTTNPLFQKTNGSYYWYQTDHLGTPQKLLDSQGNVVWEAVYEAFGKARVDVALVENNLRFAGQYFDEETGLHYNYYRYYEPTIGRYLRVDPIPSMNLYAYVLGNPLSFVDPFGLNAEALTLTGMGIMLIPIPGARVIGGILLAGAILTIPGDTPVMHYDLADQLLQATQTVTLSEALAKASNGAVNIDSGTARALSSGDLALLAQIEAALADKEMLMCTSALNEFAQAAARSPNSLAVGNALAFMLNVTIIPDSPSARVMALPTTRRMGAIDKIIFGTGDQLGIITFTGDQKFVRAATAHGVVLNVFIHPSASF